MITLKKKPKPAVLMKCVTATVGGHERRVLIAANEYSAEMLKDKKIALGDVVGVTIKKVRSPEHHAMAHRIGQLCAQNLDEFMGMDAHRVLKRLQLEADVGCEHIAIKVQNLGLIEQRIPKSLSFENMDEIEFRDVMTQICRHLSKQYWPSLSSDQIYEMAKKMDSVSH